MAKNDKPNLPPLPGAQDLANDRAMRQQARAERLKEIDRAERRRRVLKQTGIGAAVLVLVVGITVAVLALRPEPTPGIAVGERPENFDAAGAIAVGAGASGDPKVTVTLVEDFQCPVCGQFEKAAKALLAQYRDDPRVRVEYRPIAFLDRASTDRYSSRAANAAACVASSGRDTWLKFHAALYDEQPAEGGAGLSDERLLALADQAGADRDALRTCVEEEKYADWVQATTKAVFDQGVTGTPTVFVQGEKLESFDPAAVEAAVDKALG